MINYLDMLIDDVKEIDGDYFFIGYDDTGYSKIRYDFNTKIAHYGYNLSNEIVKIFGEEFMERIGVRAIVKKYVEDTLKVEVFKTGVNIIDIELVVESTL